MGTLGSGGCAELSGKCLFVMRPLCPRGQRPCRRWRGQHRERPRWPYMRLPCLSMSSFVHQSSNHPVVKRSSAHLVSDDSCPPFVALHDVITLYIVVLLHFLLYAVVMILENVNAGWIADAPFASLKHWTLFCQPSSSVLSSLFLECVWRQSTHSADRAVPAFGLSLPGGAARVPTAFPPDLQLQLHFHVEMPLTPNKVAIQQ